MRRLLLFLVAASCGVFAYTLVKAEQAEQAGLAGGENAGRAASRNGAERQCAARTKAGRACSRIAEPDSSYCWQHGG